MSPLALLAASLFSSPVQAFCGTYVGGTGGAPTNQTSHVVMVRQGQRTTLTMAGDARGVSPSFGMMVPVPGEVSKAELLDDLDLVERVDSYAGPRLVSYSCEELHGFGASGGGGQQAVCGMVASMAKDQLRSAILAEANGLLGDLVPGMGSYEVDVLAPSSVADLDDWAGLRGWSMDPEARALMAPHIDRGGGVVTVGVDLDEARFGGVMLKPLQIAYESDAMVVPVKLGAVGASGTQDLVITVITDMADGAVGIANHDEFAVETECMWRDEGPSFDAFYEDQITEGYQQGGDGVAWTTEYVWAPAKCDPCTDEGPLEEEVLRELGYDGNPGEAVLTRLRVRMDPERVQDDLVLYASGMSFQQQQRFILHDASLESDFPICGEGWAPDPGTCDDAAPVAPSPAGLPLLPLGGLVAGLGAMFRRRD
jgi:hypothetical protein